MIHGKGPSTTKRPLDGRWLFQRARTRAERERLGARLLESERLFRTTFEQAVVGIAHVSPEGRWLRFNQRLCDILGYDREELAARTFDDVTHPDDRDASRVYFERLLAGEVDAFEVDKRYVRKDGAPVWAHLTVSLVRTPGGAPAYTISMVQDITERKRLERERVRLLQQERAARLEAGAARAEAEATNAQVRALQALTDTALSHLTLDDLLRELLGRLLAVMGLDDVAILLLDADGQTLTVRAACGPAEEAIGQVQIPVGCGIAGRIAARKAPLIVEDTSAFDVADPILREKLHSVAGAPLLVEGRLVGVVQLGSVAPRRFTEADVHLLQRAADRIALAIGRALLYAAEQDARARAEAALARAIVSEIQATERAERLKAILETMADAVIVYDRDSRVIQFNRATRELLALDHMPGLEAIPYAGRFQVLDVRDATTGRPFPIERTLVARALRGEVVTGLGVEYRLRALDGRELEVNGSAAPLRDSDGRVVGAVSVLRDMTWRNRLEREREEALASELATREVNEHMEGFLAAAAHDLRTPLTATVGFIALAERSFQRLASAAQGEGCNLASSELARRVEAVRGRLEDAGESAERLSRLLTVLFDTAALRAGKLELHRASCDLAALVRDQVEGQRVAAPRRIIRLQILTGEPVLVEADADRLRQVVANYLANAVKYAPPNRPVDVSVESFVAAGESRARVAVRDAGPGLPEAERARVWEPFHRAPRVAPQGTLQGGAGGGSLGLGLHICKAIIKAHGGRVGVESAVGEGSTFWFTLPLAHADADATTP